jgi:hypothetical protein
MAYSPYPQSGPYQQRSTQQGTDADYAAWQQRGGVSDSYGSRDDAMRNQYRQQQSETQRRSTSPFGSGSQTWGSGAMGSGSSPYSGWGGTGGTTGSTGRNAGLTGSTGGATPGSNPTGGGTNAWNNTDRSNSAWGSGNMFGGTTGQGNTTGGQYSTNPVQPQGNPANWNGSSGLPPSPSLTNSTLADWFKQWQGGNFPTGPSTQTGQGNVPAGTAPQYGTNPVMPTWNPNQYNTNPVQPGANRTPVNQGFTWSPAPWMMGQDQAGMGSDEMSKALANQAQFQPWLQMQQNAYQWSNEFGENNTRWDQQFGETVQNNRYNQGLSTQQQAMAEWIAQNQQNNWQSQFGLDSELGRGNLALGNRQAGIDEAYKQGQLGVAQQQNVIDEMYKRGQLSNEQYANESNRNYQTGQLGIGNRELDLKDWYQREQSNLTREGYTSQQQIAAMNAFGRAQRPQARWVRSWG